VELPQVISDMLTVTIPLHK